jgi:hypothetical protein
MAYETQQWIDFNKAFAVSAARMTHIEEGIFGEESRARQSEIALGTSVSTEKGRAESAEATIRSNLTAEQTRAETAEGSVSGALTSEKNRAETAESSVKTEVATEKSRAETKENNLTTSISTEKTRAEAAEISARTTAEAKAVPLTQKGAPEGVAILGADGKVPSSQLPPAELADTKTVTTESELLALKPTRTTIVIVTSIPNTFIWLGTKTQTIADWEEFKFVTGVTEVNGKKGSVLTLSAADVKADVEGAATTAKNEAKSEAKSEVAAEKTRAQGAETTNATAIANEKTRAEGSETSINASVTSEKSRAETKEGVLNTAIGTEKTRAENVEGTISASVNSEKTRAESAEATNASAITGEKNRAIGVETTIETSVANEKTRAEAAEAAAVKLTTNQTVAGIKTFSSSPIVPAATTPKQAAALEQITAETTRATAAEGTEKTRAEAAEATKIPLAQKGAASGVAELDNTSRIPFTQLPTGVVPSRRASSVSIAGTFKPDLKEGQRAFPITTTGALIVESPINPPAEKEALYVEIFIKGNNPITIPAVTKWVDGQEPKFELESPNSINIVMMVSQDNGTSWYGIGSSNVSLSEAEEKFMGISGNNGRPITVLGKPEVGYSPIGDGTNAKWGLAGLSENAIKEIVAERSLGNTTSNLFTLGSGTPVSDSFMYFGESHTTTLTTALSKAGSEITTLNVEPLEEYLNVGAIVLVKHPTEAKIQNYTVSKTTAPGATEISVNSLKPNADFPIGSTVKSSAPTSAILTSFSSKVLEKSSLRFGAPITAAPNVQLVVNTIYDNVFTGGTAKVTLPVGNIPVEGLVVGINNHVGAVTQVKGNFEADLTKETEMTLTGTEMVYFMSKFVSGGPAASVWVPLPGWRTLTSLEALVTAKVAPGSWEPFTGMTKTKQAEGVTAYSLGARLEQGGANVRMRGIIQVNAGESITNGTTLFTLPSSVRPKTENVWVTARTATGTVALLVAESGKVSNASGATLTAGTQVGLDSITFSVT